MEIHPSSPPRRSSIPLQLGQGHKANVHLGVNLSHNRQNEKRGLSPAQRLDNQFFPEQWLVVKWHDDLYLSDFQEPTFQALTVNFTKSVLRPEQRNPELGVGDAQSLADLISRPVFQIEAA